MDGESWLLFSIILLLILVDGYFAATETAFALSNRIRVKTRSDGGDKRARNALYVLEHFDKALSTLLIGNNIIHIGIASLETLLVTRLWGSHAVAGATIAVTAVVFLVSEMIPKSFASHRSEGAALFLAPSLRVLMVVFTPLSAVFNAFADLFARLLGREKTPTVTEDELYHIIESAADSGRMGKDRRRLIHSAVDFSDITAGEIATPLSSVVGVEAGSLAAEILDIIRNTKFTRLPVYQGTPLNIIGVLSIRTFIKRYLQQGETVSLPDLMDKPYFAAKEKRIDILAREMSERRIHIAVIQGGGIVTMEDILEELVGEIRDEDDEAAGKDSPGSKRGPGNEN